MTERFLHAHDVAKLLNVKTSTVYALCRRGELVHIRIGECRRRPLIRFRAQDLETFLRARTVASNPVESGPREPVPPLGGSPPSRGE